MGPTILFDKSFMQALSVDESVWFDHYFSANICPLFYVETLADLTKDDPATGRTGEQEVAAIAGKSPEISGVPCPHHRDMALSSLMGQEPPRNGQIPMAGGRRVKAGDRLGIIYDKPNEITALHRWNERNFRELERDIAKGWRDSLARIDLKGVAENMRRIGFDATTCRSLEDAYRFARAVVESNDQPYDKIALLFSFTGISYAYMGDVLTRYEHAGRPSLATFAPFAAHVLSVDLFFQISLGAHQIGAERPSNRIDIAYLYYIPFCMLFVSGDRLHRRAAPLFLRPDQEFVWAPDLKADLARLNAYWLNVPDEQKAKGTLNFPRRPVGDAADLVVGIWERHVPKRVDILAEVDLGKANILAVEIEQWTKGAKAVPSGYAGNADEFDQLSIQRHVHHKKGSWFQLPEDMPPPRKQPDNKQDGGS